MENRESLKRSLAAASLTALGVAACGALPGAFSALGRTEAAEQLLGLLGRALMLLLPLAVFSALCRRPARSFLRFAPMARGDGAACCAALGVLAAANFLSEAACGALRRCGAVFPASAASFPRRGWALVFALLGATLLPALLEEIVFRGLLPELLRPWGEGPAVLLSALLFALCHSGVDQLLPAFAAGVCFGALAVSRRSLTLPVLLHLCNNALAAGTLLLADSPWAGAASVTERILAAGFAVFAAGYALRLRRGGRRLLSGPALPAWETRRAVFTEPVFLLTAALLLWRALSQVTFAR